MALKITDNFNYTGRKPNFQRDQFATTSEMNAYTVCDEGHISYNLQDNKHYSFKNGAWSVLQTGGGGSSYTHPSSHPASIITYDSSETYESGNVGYEIKQLVTSLAAKYVKPGTGIPKADLANDVQTSLGYADDYNTNKSSFLTSTALETALEGLSPYSAGTGISITTVSGGKQIAIDSSVYKVKDVQNASGTSLVNNGIATIPNATITSIKDYGGNDLTITNGAVTLPAIPTVPITQINKSDNTQLSPVSGVVTLPDIPTNASDISFDDSVAHLNTDNVQGAINLVVAAVASSISVLVINLLDYTGAPISGQSVTVTEIYNGTTNTYSVSSINGTATCSIHYGSIYTITYGNRTNRLTPSPVTGIAENMHINIFGKYALNADYENLTFSIRIKGANTNVHTPNDKHVYVDYKYGTSDNYTYTRKYTIVLNSKGAAKTIYNENNEEVNNCAVPKNQVYRISLEDYTDMDKSADKEYTAQSFDRTIEMYYYYRLSGIFLVVEDYNGSTDLDAYTEYKCLSFDDVENKVTIIDDNDDQWDIVVDSNTGDLMKSPVGQSNYSTWIEAANFNRILGIGLRTSNTIDNPIYDATAEAQGFIDSSMLITNTPRSKKAIQNSQVIWEGHPGYFSGRGNTNYMASSDEPYSEAAVYAKSITLKTGNVTQTGFIPSQEQARELYLNREDIIVLATILNYGNVLATGYFTQIFTCSQNTNQAQWYVISNGTGPQYPAAIRTQSNNVIILFSF